jgi:hypothetical protein
MGEANYQAELKRIAEPKTPDGAGVQVSAFLMPEPENPYDSNAVAVIISDKAVGYLSRDNNEEFLKFLHEVGASGACCEASSKGNWKHARSEGNFCVRLDIAWPFEAAQ